MYTTIRLGTEILLAHRESFGNLDFLTLGVNINLLSEILNYVLSQN